MERDEALAALREVAVEVLSVEPDAVTEEARFKEDLDADSLDLVELVMGLEERFDISVPEEDLEDVGDRRPGGRPRARQGRGQGVRRHEPWLTSSTRTDGHGSPSPAWASRRPAGSDVDSFWATVRAGPWHGRRRSSGSTRPSSRCGSRCEVARLRPGAVLRPEGGAPASTASRSSASPPPPTRSSDAGELGADPSRCAVIAATGVGGLDDLEENESTFLAARRRAGSARSSCR